jgi:hypothetical protein
MSRTASLAATQVTASSIADGEVVVTDAAGKILTSSTAATAKEIVVVQGQGASKPLIKSDVIKLGKVSSYSGKGAVAAVEQVSYIGYNGNAGTSIDALASNLYFARLNMLNEQNTYGNRTMYLNFKYETGITTSQKDVATGLFKNAITIKTAEQMYKFERIADGTKTAATAATSGTSKSIFVVASGTTAPTATVAKGSKTVTFTTAANILSVNFIVGDIIELNGVAYIIASLGTTGTTKYVVTLDTAYQGADATLAASVVKFWNTADPVNWGIKVTGVAKSYIPGVLRYYKVRFGLSLKDFGATTLTEPGTSPAVGANEGSGTTEQIQELEWFCQGTSGKLYRISVPPAIFIANAAPYLAYNGGTANVGFATITVNFFDQDPGVIGQTLQSPKSLIIAAPSTAFTTGASSASVGTNFDAAGDNTSVADVLDAFMGLAGNGSLTALTNTWYI